MMKYKLHVGLFSGIGRHVHSGLVGDPGQLRKITVRQKNV